MKQVFIVILYACTLVSCAQQTAESTATNPDPLEIKIDEIFADFKVLDAPGYAIGISKNGSTVYANGYGAANLDYQLPITPQSTFSLASVSKQFTAACIALLILEEKISLETDVSIYIPELKKYPDTIRLKHLIYNSSGIIDYYKLPRKGGHSWVTFNYFDIDECIATSLAQESLQFKPSSQWDYCNVNFMLLTKIVEEISGQAFRDFAKSRLFEPLGMHHTLINDDITQVVPNRVTPYNKRTKENIASYTDEGFKLSAKGEYIQHTRNAPHYGGSGVMSTIEDLLKWTASMETKSFKGQAFYDLMHATLKFEHGRNNQAFGLYIGDFNGREIVAWDGDDYGISAQIMRFSKQNVSIIVLSNLGSGEAYRKANAIAAVLIEGGVLD